MAVHNHSQGIIVVELPGEPDIRVELDKVMDILNAEANNDIIMDFTNVDIMTSLTLSGFLKARERVINAGRRMIFVNIAPITKGIFKVTCFDGIFEFADTKEQAVTELNLVQVS